jgi:hypothetical protein
MANEFKEAQQAQREEKLIADCRALIAQGAKGRAAAVSMYRLAKQCDRLTAMRALGLS